MGWRSNSNVDLAIYFTTKQTEKNEISKKKVGNNYYPSEDSTKSNRTPIFEFEMGSLINDRYKLKQYISKGTYGKVALAYDIQEKKEVALKILAEKSSRELTVAKFIFSQKLTDFHREHLPLPLDYFEIGKRYAFIYDLMEIELSDQYADIKSKSPLEKENFMKPMAYDILSSLLAYRQLNLLHADVKVSNIMARNGKYRLVDFGLACNPYSNHKMGLNCRIKVEQHKYRAPEVILRHGNYNEQIDMFAFGIVLYKGFVGKDFMKCETKSTQELICLCRTIDRLGMPSNEYIEKTSESSRRIKEAVNLRRRSDYVPWHSIENKLINASDDFENFL